MLLVAYGINNGFAIDINDNRVFALAAAGKPVRFEFLHLDLQPRLFVDANYVPRTGWQFTTSFPEGHQHDDAIPTVMICIAHDRDSLALSADVYDVWRIRVACDGKPVGDAHRNEWFQADARAA